MSTETSRDARGALPPIAFDIVDRIPGVMPPYVIQIEGGTLSDEMVRQIHDRIVGKTSGPLLIEAEDGGRVRLKIMPLHVTPPELKNISAFGGPWCDVEAQRLTYYRCERGRTQETATILIDLHIGTSEQEMAHVTTAAIAHNPDARNAYRRFKVPVLLAPGDRLHVDVDLAIIDAAAITTQADRDWLATHVLGRVTAKGHVVALIEVDPPPPDIAPAA